MAQVRPHRVRRDEQLGSDLRRLQVARQVPDDAELSLAQLVQHRRGLAARRPAMTRRARRGSRRAALACAVRCRGGASADSLHRRERERQDDPLGLGELERPLQRRLRCAGCRPSSSRAAASIGVPRLTAIRRVNLPEPRRRLRSPGPARPQPARGCPPPGESARRRFARRPSRAPWGRARRARPEREPFRPSAPAPARSVPAGRSSTSSLRRPLIRSACRNAASASSSRPCPKRSMPHACRTTSSVRCAPSLARARSARSRLSCASSKRPSQTSSEPRKARAGAPSMGSSAHP